MYLPNTRLVLLKRDYRFIDVSNFNDTYKFDDFKLNFGFERVIKTEFRDMNGWNQVFVYLYFFFFIYFVP